MEGGRNEREESKVCGKTSEEGRKKRRQQGKNGGLERRGREEGEEKSEGDPDTLGWRMA